MCRLRSCCHRSCVVVVILNLAEYPTAAVDGGSAGSSGSELTLSLVLTLASSSLLVAAHGQTDP